MEVQKAVMNRFTGKCACDEGKDLTLSQSLIKADVARGLTIARTMTASSRPKLRTTSVLT